MQEPQENQDSIQPQEKQEDQESNGFPEYREPLVFEIRNTEEDLMTAMELIDRKNKASSRRTLHLLAVILILYWFVPMAWNDPKQPLNWIMIVLALGLGVMVAKGQEYDNRRYAKRTVETAPLGTVTVDEEKILFQDGRGDSHFYFDQGIAIYGFRGILAIKAAKNRFGMIPQGQLEGEIKENLYNRLRDRLGDNFVEQEPEAEQPGFFGKKRQGKS